MPPDTGFEYLGIINDIDFPRSAHFVALAHVSILDTDQ
jgi:hypothetical protein